MQFEVGSASTNLQERGILTYLLRVFYYLSCIAAAVVLHGCKDRFGSGENGGGGAKERGARKLEKMRGMRAEAGDVEGGVYGKTLKIRL